MIAETFADCLDRTMAGLAGLFARGWEPSLAVAPNWHALAALEDAGIEVADTDPVCEMAFWELAAAAALEQFGDTATGFARLCGILAHDVLAGVAS